MQSAGVQSYHWLERLKLRGCCGRFLHTCLNTLGFYLGTYDQMSIPEEPKNLVGSPDLFNKC